MKFVYLKLKFQKVFKNWDDNDSNLHFGYTFLIVSCNLEANLEERIKRKKGKKKYQQGSSGLLWHPRVTGASNQSSSKWSQQV